MEKGFNELFKVSKPIIGMLHMAGDYSQDKIMRAMGEMRIYQEEGVDGVIIENYHGDVKDVMDVTRYSKWYDIIRGVNILGKPFESFVIAHQYRLPFIQLDSVQTQGLALSSYNLFRDEHPNLVVLGGVGFKYTQPTGNPLEQDIREGMSRCEAIVTTGPATGIETPISKLKQFKEIMGPSFSLISGAGVTAENLREQAQYADGFIVGSYFKPNGNTQLKVDRTLVRKFMDVISDIRKDLVF